MHPAPTIEVRDLEFDLNASVPRYWHGAGRAVTLFFDNLSIFFPPGERFFIASVKKHSNLIQDEKLKKDVKQFCAQEGVHSREHVRFNRVVAEKGLTVAELEQRVERLLRAVTRVFPLRIQLAVTCALEHFTALMAESLLSDSQVMAGAHPEMEALWRWHAAEENEHKAVAYDVYTAVGGNYAERVATMILATLIFWYKVGEQQVRLMHADGCLWSFGEWTKLFKFLFVSPGALSRVFVPYFTYYRLGFHPWDYDNRDLLEAFRRDFATSAVYRRAA